MWTQVEEHHISQNALHLLNLLNYFISSFCYSNLNSHYQFNSKSWLYINKTMYYKFMCLEL